jgi:hypothetical protein
LQPAQAISEARSFLGLETESPEQRRAREDAAEAARARRARQQAEAAGRQVVTALVVDACRTATMAPPPTARLEPAPGWQLFSVQAGAFAEEVKQAVTVAIDKVRQNPSHT